MIRKLAAITFLLILLCSAMVGRTLAQTTVPGVSVGNFFNYDFTAFWSSSAANAVVPPDLADLNKTWIGITITDVSDSVVSMSITWHYENGTENTSEAWVNIDTGEDSVGYGFVVAPNLGANSVVYPSGDYSFSINETVMRTYSGGERETNHYEANLSDVGNFVFSYDNLYLDKKTGIMVEWYTERFADISPNEKTAIHWKIKETNVWVVPEFPSLLILPFFMIATLLAVIIYRRKHLGNQVEKTGFAKIIISEHNANWKRHLKKDYFGRQPPTMRNFLYFRFCEKFFCAFERDSIENYG